jgi:asparagine synthase (glutamine-hydrolysing)
MCGIFGAVGFPVSDEAARNVLLTLRHRGPEAQGVERIGQAVLAHTRLRILDLSPSGAQPMANEDGSVWVTFNGEIYNFASLRQELEAFGHVFRSRSDTEVIVHGYEQWGAEVVTHLDGMFAFGIWDRKAERLLLGRDRAGKKPLFFVEHGGGFLFASEIKALFAAGVPLEIDLDGLTGFLAYGYAPPPGTMYRGIRQLPPAHLLVYTPTATAPLRIDRYWSLDFTPSRGDPEPEATERVRYLMTEAVRKRMVADVPIGAFLSGGIDSTIVVGIMAQLLGNRVRTFSIGFSGDPRYDETRFARIAAKAFGTEHTEFTVKPSDFEILDQLIWHHDGPFGDSSAIPTYVVSRLTRQQVTVALTGDGGDELFAGYLRFWAAIVAQRIPAGLRAAGKSLARLIPDGLPSRGFAARTRRFLNAADLPLCDRLTQWNSYFAFTLDELLHPDVKAVVNTEAVLDFHRRLFASPRPKATTLSQALNHNFLTYLPQDLLVKMDRTSMAHALETRSPFLDTALMEYVAPLPDNYKLRHRTTKFILRRAFANLIPPEIQSRGKMGFGVPLASWFRGNLRSFVADHITAPQARIGAFVQMAQVRKLVDAHTQGIADHEHQIWALLTMEIWLRQLSRLGRTTDMSGP